MTSLRRRLIAKLCASLFIVLIALPFTAPFRAWDSGTPIGKPSANDLKTSDELSNSTAILAGPASEVPAAHGVVRGGRTVDDRAAQPRAFQIVLRL